MIANILSCTNVNGVHHVTSEGSAITIHDINRDPIMNHGIDFGIGRQETTEGEREESKNERARKVLESWGANELAA